MTEELKEAVNRGEPVVRSLDIGLMRSGATQRQAQHAFISDVHKLAENDCLLLRQLTALFPGLRWFIVGGSPCQDLIYAGCMVY